jgi:hypothetical protein
VGQLTGVPDVVRAGLLPERPADRVAHEEVGVAEVGLDRVGEERDEHEVGAARVAALQ